MFALNELLIIRSSLVVQSKSVQRLAAKEGQPESVALEYRKVFDDISSVMKHVEMEITKIQVDEKNKQVKK